MNLGPVIRDRLAKGLAQLGISIDPEPLLHYLSLLEKWNQTYNLTAIRDLDTMLTHHILDSLAILPWVRGKRVLDVGTGAGLPGMALAIANAEIDVVLMDSNGKKIRFLQEIQRQLKLPNVEVIQSRVENYHPSVDFDTVTSRAFSELAQMIKWTRHLLIHDGIWLAMKGRYPATELASINLPYQVKSYTVPGLVGERCCVIIENVTKE